MQFPREAHEMDFTINGVPYRIDTDAQLVAFVEATPKTMPKVLVTLRHPVHATAA